MDYSLDNLRKLVEKLKTISFFGRLFAWGKIKSLLIDANGDIQKIAPSLENARAENAKIENQLSTLSWPMDSCRFLMLFFSMDN